MLGIIRCTSQNKLLIFFGKIYHGCAALLDLKNPLKVLGRLKKPLFSPKASWEKSGVTDNVVFPTGVVRDKRLYIYYGAGDKLIAAKSVDLAELLTELKKNPQNYEH